VAASAPGFAASFWFGLHAPSGTPPALVAQLSRTLGEAMRDPAFIATMTTAGYDLRPGTPEQYAAFVRSESERLGAAAREAGLKAE
jgi:tripartite-type tricarboxylate transporter receptor subunit TctC